ncbi:MAG: DUF3127 domain-containing protein [Chitinophagaceae bacterium]
MALEITGKVVKVLPEQSGTSKTGNAWKKGGFIIETESNFPKKICFTAWGDLSSQVNSLKEGQNLKVSFDVESREFNDKWYTDLKAWKIDATGSEITPGKTESPSISKPESVTEPASESSEESSDDLPF